MLGRIRIGIVFDVFVYIFRGARNWEISCRPAFLTSDSREMAFNIRWCLILLINYHFNRFWSKILFDIQKIVVTQ